jgi:FtsZ-binding cell division protein ZapB
MINLFSQGKSKKDLISERDYYKNCLNHYKKESTNIGKIINLEEENEELLETLGFLEYELEKSKNENDLLKEENKKYSDLFNKMSDDNDSLAEQRDVYKETIKVLCGRHGIRKSEVYEILDTAQDKISHSGRER